MKKMGQRQNEDEVFEESQVLFMSLENKLLENPGGIDIISGETSIFLRI